MSNEYLSSEPISEGMLYGPPLPPELYPEPKQRELTIDTYPNRKMAESIMEEANGDMGYYNLMMLRAQLVADKSRGEVSIPVFERNYRRLNSEIGKYHFQLSNEIIQQRRPLPPTTRSERKRRK